MNKHPHTFAGLRIWAHQSTTHYFDWWRSSLFKWRGLLRFSLSSSRPLRVVSGSDETPSPVPPSAAIPLKLKQSPANKCDILSRGRTPESCISYKHPLGNWPPEQSALFSLSFFVIYMMKEPGYIRVIQCSFIFLCCSPRLLVGNQ